MAKSLSLEFVNTLRVTLNPWYAGCSGVREMFSRFHAPHVLNSNPLSKLEMNVVNGQVPAAVDVAFEDGSSLKLQAQNANVRDLVAAIRRRQQQVSMKVKK
jgi:hypothetical protein